MRAWSALVCVALVLNASAGTAQEHVVVRGVVIDAGTGDPVAGAEVVAAGAHALSAEDGAWRIELPRGTHTLVVTHLAFAQAAVAVRAGRDVQLTIRLTPRPVALNELVVTASRRLQQLKDVAVATEVVAREEIERAGSADLSAVLVERTGIAAEGGHPVGAGVMLQGLGSERVLILVDGQPFIGRLSGSLDLSRVPASMVERVEVVKGPQSTLYGSEAMGGVVNIITRSREPGPGALTLSAIGGSQARLDVNGGVRGSTGPLSYGVDLGRRSVELVPGHAGTAGTYVTRLDAGGSVRRELTPSTAVHASALLLDERQRWRSGVLYHFADNVQWGGRAGITRGGWTATLYGTEFRHLSRRSTLAEPVASPDDESEVQRLVEAELLYSREVGAVVIDGGAEVRRESIHSDRVAGTDRVLHGIEPFAQGTWQMGAWSVVPGVRVSWSEQWGAHVTPRLAAMVRPTDDIALRASVGRGFRAPSFKELYMDFLNTGAGAGYRVSGNPALRPETSTNLTGSIEWTGEQLYGRLQSFYNRFDDFIETQEVPDGGSLTRFTYDNIDDGETYGVELEIGATWGGLRAEAGYGWLRARDRASGEPLLGRPEHSARGSLAYALPFGLRASVSGVHTGATFTSRGADGELVRRDALTRIDARIAQALPYGVELSAGVDNVLDASIADYPGWLGRQLYIGARWTATP